jgi:hypothetical protein
MAPLLGNGLFALPSLRPEDRNRLQPLISDMSAFPFGEVSDALMALWFAEGETKHLAAAIPDIEKIIEGRNLPPYMARRLRKSNGDRMRVIH